MSFSKQFLEKCTHFSEGFNRDQGWYIDLHYEIKLLGFIINKTKRVSYGSILKHPTNYDFIRPPQRYFDDKQFLINWFKNTFSE